MKITSWKKDKLYTPIILLVSVFVIYTIMYFSQHSCFFGDDFYFSLFCTYEDFFNTLSFEKGGHGGGYIGYFLCELFSFALPVLLNIHPNDFICSYHPLIEGIFLVLTILSISSFAIVHNRSKFLYTLCFIFLSGYIYYRCCGTSIIDVDYSFYRYLFSLLPFSLLWLYIYKNLITNCKKLNYKTLIIVCIFAYIVGSASEILFFASLFLAFELFFYNFFIKIFKLSDEYKLNINYKFSLPIGIMTFVIYLFTSSSGYKVVAADRGMENINITLQTLQEFSILFWEKCFCNEYYYWVLFCLLVIVSFVMALKRKELKKIVFPILFQIASLAVIYSLILCGKTYNDTFFIEHVNVMFLYKILILFPLFILLGYCYKFFARKKILNILLLFISVYISIICFKYFYNSTQLIDVYNFKREEYQIQKIIRFYNLKNEIPIIKTDYLPMAEGLSDDGRTYLFAMNLIYNNQIQYDLKTAENAMELFYENGGVFTEQELEELKFQRLKDDDFILNRKAPE